MRLPVGTGPLMRAFLRRDRVMLAWFVVGVTVLYWSQATKVRSLYATQAELDRAAQALGANSAFTAMLGPARGLDSVGGLVAWQASAFGAIVIALMAMFVIVRHTRAEEESGRDEVLRAAPIGRQAPQTAAVLLMVAASAICGLLVTGSLTASGLAVGGAAVLGVGLALCGCVFTGVALLAAQLSSTTRSAYGITGSVIGIAYGLRSIGDVGAHALSWFSPIGWYQAMRPYAGERWWPALILIGATVALLTCAYAVFDRRDVGAGVWPTRPGPAHGSLNGALALAWRLHRGALLGWGAGLLLLGLSYGSIGDSVGSIVGDSQFIKDVFGGTADQLVDSFYAVAASMIVLLGSAFAISAALRPRHEESAGLLEPLLSTALPRLRWLGSHVAIVWLGTIGLVALGGLGLGLGFAASTGDTSRVVPLLGAILSLLPGALLLAALATALVGVWPRHATWAWAGLGFCAVVLLFGGPLHLPDWLREVSPFTHFPRVPAEAMAWGPFAIVGVLALALTAVGFAGFARRDVS